jgi:hypothetical protein
MGGDDVIALPADTWRAIRDRAEQLLTAAEIDGITGAITPATARAVEGARALAVIFPPGANSIPLTSSTLRRRSQHG